MIVRESAELVIIPRPKLLRADGGYFRLTRNTPLLAHAGCAGEAKLLSSLLADGTGVECRVRRGKARGAIEMQLVPRLPDVSPSDDGYLINVTREAVTLKAVTGRGLYYAGQSLLDLVRRAEGGWIIPCCAVADWPDCSYRGFMADPARHFYSLDRLKWDVDLLARNKYTHFHLHFSDAESFTLPTRRYPKLNMVPPGPHGVYTRSELRELCRYAAARKIEIVPEIDLPGHASYILAQYPELRCRVAHDKPKDWAICVGSEKTYRFLERLLDEIVPLFPGNLFHVGGDELEFKEHIDRIFFSWRECPECRDRMRRNSLANYRELFYYFLIRLRRMLAKHGKRMMMWNDNIDIAKPNTVPRDILQQFWRIAGKGRGPRRGCSLNKFVENGFQVVNSFYPDTYLDLYLREERLVKWHPRKNPPVSGANRHRIIGGECCAWSDGGKDPYPRTLPSALAVFGDRLWNRSPVARPDRFAAALARHILGPQTPEEMAVLFHVLGAMALHGGKLYELRAPLLRRLPRRRRLELCEMLLRTIDALRGKGPTMNDLALEEYARSLDALRRKLQSA